MCFSAGLAVAAGIHVYIPSVGGPHTVYPEVSTVRYLRCDVHVDFVNVPAFLRRFLPLHHRICTGLLRPAAEPGIEVKLRSRSV